MTGTLSCLPKWFAGALLGLAAVYLAAGTRAATETPIIGIEFNEQSVITRVYRGSPGEAAGLRPRDRVLKVEGVDVGKQWGGPHGYLAGSRAGDVRRFVVDRQGEQVELVVTLGRPSPRFLYMRLASSIVGLSFLVSGAILFFRRTTRPSSAFYLLCVAMAVQLIYPPAFTSAVGRPAFAIMQVAASFTFAVTLLYLFLIFPKPSPWIATRPYLVKALFSVALVCALALIGTALLSHAGVGLPKSLPTVINVASGGLISGYIVLAIVAFLHRYVTTPAGPSKRAIRMMLAGTLLGLLPLLTHQVLSIFFPSVKLPSSQYVLLLLILIPVTFSFAILRGEAALDPV